MNIKPIQSAFNKCATTCSEALTRKGAMRYYAKNGLAHEVNGKLQKYSKQEYISGFSQLERDVVEKHYNDVTERLLDLRIRFALGGAYLAGLSQFAYKIFNR